MSAHANFVSVHVPKPSGSQSEQSSDDYPPQSSPQNFIWDLAEQPTVSLLCTSRGLLKKMKQKVFVGDIVTVSNIDWIIAQGNRQHPTINSAVSLLAYSTRSVNMVHGLETCYRQACLVLPPYFVWNWHEVFGQVLTSERHRLGK